MTEIRPAATVMCVRSGNERKPEILLLRRNTEVDFAAGFWVFPGGKVEQTEIQNDQAFELAARQAAIREAEEEAGLHLSSDELTFFCHWTTPAPSNKRFGTWFFVTHLDTQRSNVTIDDSEIKDHLWLSAENAFNMLHAQRIKLLPPTFLILNRIRRCSDFTSIKSELMRSAPLIVKPKVGVIDGIFQSMYPGDAGYDSHDVCAAGPRHRLTGDIRKGTYGFEYFGCEHHFPLHGGYEW